MKTPLLFATLLSFWFNPQTPAHASVVAYWNFNNLSISSANPPGSGEVPSTISSDQGSGNVDLSAWGGTVDDFGGSTTNRLGTDPAGQSLSLIAASGTSGNDTSITFNFSMLGLQNPILSFVTQGTATGFNSNQLAYSINGSDFTDFNSPYAPASSYAPETFDLSSIDTLDGASAAYLRLTFAGASGSSGNNRIDNIQINAIPEPSALSALGVMTLLLLSLRHKRT